MISVEKIKEGIWHLYKESGGDTEELYGLTEESGIKYVLRKKDGSSAIISRENVDDFFGSNTPTTETRDAIIESLRHFKNRES